MADVLKTAVLKTVNMGVEPDVDDVLGDGVMEGLVVGLARVEDFVAVLKNNVASVVVVVTAAGVVLATVERLNVVVDSVVGEALLVVGCGVGVSCVSLLLTTSSEQTT